MRREELTLANGDRLTLIQPISSPLEEVSKLRTLAVRGGKEGLLTYVRSHDAIIRLATLGQRRPKLVVFDLDGTLVAGEFMLHIAEQLLDSERGERLLQLTQVALHGTEEWKSNYKERVALLEGLELDKLQRQYKQLSILKGAKELVAQLQRCRIKVGIITGAWSEYAGYIAKQLGADYCLATKWESRDGKVTGRIEGETLGPTEKLTALKELMHNGQVEACEVAVVGDGYNDLEMMTVAGCNLFVHATQRNPLPLAECIGHLLTDLSN